MTYRSELAADVRFLDRLTLAVAEDLTTAAPTAPARKAGVAVGAEGGKRRAAAPAEKRPRMSGAQRRTLERQRAVKATDTAAKPRETRRESVKAAKKAAKRVRREERRMDAADAAAGEGGGGTATKGAR